MTSVTGVTPNEMFESLTGFDEIAIAQHFGEEWQDLAQKKPIQFLRALAFVHITRDGKSPQDAKKEALGLSVKQAQAYFEDEPNELPGSEPSDAGKDAEPGA